MFFSTVTAEATRGRPSKLFQKRSRLDVRANAFRVRVVSDWNSLPTEVVTAPSLNSFIFKARLDKFWCGDLHHILSLRKMRLVIRLNQHVTMSILHTDTVTLPQIKTIREGRWNLGPVPQISLSLSLRWWTSHRIAC